MRQGPVRCSFRSSARSLVLLFIASLCLCPHLLSQDLAQSLAGCYRVREIRSTRPWDKLPPMVDLRNEHHYGDHSPYLRVWIHEPDRNEYWPIDWKPLSKRSFELRWSNMVGIDSGTFTKSGPLFVGFTRHCTDVICIGSNCPPCPESHRLELKRVKCP